MQPADRGNRRLSSETKRRKRWLLLWAQQCVCAGCGGPLDLSVEPDGGEYPTVDHVVPWGDGGTNKTENLLMKHRRCNEKRGDDAPTGWDRRWQAIVRERLSCDPKWEDCRDAVLALTSTGDDR